MRNSRIALGLAMVIALAACRQESAPAPTADVATPVPEAPVAEVMPVVPSAGASLVLPGAFSEATTVADFETLFGKANVAVSEAPQTDGSTLRSLVLFPDDPTRRAYVTFHDPQAMTGLASILVNDAGSRWRGKHGVEVGMSLAELRALNGRSVHFSGFDEQRHAWVRDQWSVSLDDSDATLGKLDVEEGDRLYFGVDLGIPDASVPADAFPADDWTSSDDPDYPRLGEIVEVTAISAYSSLDDEWE